MKKKKIISLSVLFAILLGTGLWIKSRWSVWFGNPEEEVYSPLNSPGRILLSFGKNALSRNVSWQCDSVVQPSRLLLVDTQEEDTVSIEAVGEVFASRSGKGAYYVARLLSLKPDRTYSYQVCSGAKRSSWYRFSTHNGKTANDYSFMYMGDVQDTIGGKAGVFLREALRKHKDTEFIVFGGDLAERPMDNYWGEVFQSLDSVSQSFPVMSVTGNHEYLKYLKRKLERRYSLIFSYYLDSKVGDNQVYTLKYNDLQLFFLDSNRELPFLWQQRNWLETELKHSKARWKIVVLHHPLYSIRGKSNNLMPKFAFNSLIKDYKVDLVLQGHEHAYSRRTTHNDDGSLTTPVYTVSHCSPKGYPIEFGEDFDRFGISSRYYQRIHLHGDTLTMVAYDVNTRKVYDSIDIVKKKQLIVVDNAKGIPEYLEFTPRKNKKEDAKFAKRIEEYKQRKAQR